jgi:hypothetical protein
MRSLTNGFFVIQSIVELSNESQIQITSENWFRVRFEYTQLVRVELISVKVSAILRRKLPVHKPVQFSNSPQHVSVKCLTFESFLIIGSLLSFRKLLFAIIFCIQTLLDIEFCFHSTEPQFSPLSSLKMWTVNRSHSLTSIELWCWRAARDAADSRAVPARQSCCGRAALASIEREEAMQEINLRSKSEPGRKHDLVEGRFSP